MLHKLDLADGKSVEVKKLVIADFALVLKKFNKLPQLLSTFETFTADAIISALPEMLAGSLDELIDIIATATTASVEELKQLDLADFTLLVATILEVNRYDEIAGFLARIGNKWTEGKKANQKQASQKESSKA